MTTGKGGHTLCVSQCSLIAHRGGGEPGTRGGQGGHPWGGAEAGGTQEEGEGVSKLVLASPLPYTASSGTPTTTIVCRIGTSRPQPGQRSSHPCGNMLIHHELDRGAEFFTNYLLSFENGRRKA